MSKMCARISSAVRNTDTSSLIASPLSFFSYHTGNGEGNQMGFGAGLRGGSVRGTEGSLSWAQGKACIVMLTPQALECVAWISNQQAMSKKLLALAFLNFKQFGNRLARPVSMVYNGETNGRRMTLCPQEICCVDLTILRSVAWRSVCTYRIC